MLQMIRLHDKDDVANVLGHVSRGEAIVLGDAEKPLIAISDIPKHHKIALRDLPQGTHVMRGGLAIGAATRDIAAGAHVHIHNLESLRARATKGATQ